MGQRKTCASSKICKVTKDVKQIGKTFCWTILDSPYEQERCLLKLAKEAVFLFGEEKDKVPVKNKKGWEERQHNISFHSTVPPSKEHLSKTTSTFK